MLKEARDAKIEILCKTCFYSWCLYEGSQVCPFDETDCLYVNCNGKRVLKDYEEEEDE